MFWYFVCETCILIRVQTAYKFWHSIKCGLESWNGALESGVESKN